MANAVLLGFVGSSAFQVSRAPANGYVNLVEKLGIKASGANDDTFWAIFELHELGDILRGLTNDINDPSLSLKNTQTVIDKCFKDLKK